MAMAIRWNGTNMPQAELILEVIRPVDLARKLRHDLNVCAQEAAQVNSSMRLASF
jgi:Ni2+-binding GTPase involved in maturation of urease and hydrogenase